MGGFAWGPHCYGSTATSMTTTTTANVALTGNTHTVTSTTAPSPNPVAPATRQISSGSCHDIGCAEMSEHDCQTLAGETRNGFYRFDASSWAPNAADGYPAPDHCYTEPLNGYLFFNRRATSQDATNIRHKLCMCPSEAPTPTILP